MTPRTPARPRTHAHPRTRAPTPLRSASSPRTIERIIATILFQWMDLIVEVQDTRLKYYRKWQLLKLRAYFGKGMEPGQPDGLKMFWRGWSSDLWYYCKNNHPLFVMILEDKDHPFSKNERMVKRPFTLSQTLSSSKRSRISNHHNQAHHYQHYHHHQHHYHDDDGR